MSHPQAALPLGSQTRGPRALLCAVCKFTESHCFTRWASLRLGVPIFPMARGVVVRIDRVSECRLQRDCHVQWCPQPPWEEAVLAASFFSPQRCHRRPSGLKQPVQEVGPRPQEVPRP